MHSDENLVKLLRQGWRGETATDLMREAAERIEKLAVGARASHDTTPYASTSTPWCAEASDHRVRIVPVGLNYWAWACECGSVSSHETPHVKIAESGAFTHVSSEHQKARRARQYTAAEIEGESADA